MEQRIHIEGNDYLELKFLHLDYPTKRVVMSFTRITVTDVGYTCRPMADGNFNIKLYDYTRKNQRKLDKIAEHILKHSDVIFEAWKNRDSIAVMNLVFQYMAEVQ